MDPKHVPYPEAVRQWGRGRPPIPAPTFRRRYRNEVDRVAPMSLTNRLREQIARVRAPGRGASLADIVAVLHDVPLGRHGFQSVHTLAVNARALRELFAEYPVAVAA